MRIDINYVFNYEYGNFKVILSDVFEYTLI